MNRDDGNPAPGITEQRTVNTGALLYILQLLKNVGRPMFRLGPAQRVVELRGFHSRIATGCQEESTGQRSRVDIESRIVVGRECTETIPPACGQCVERFEKPTTICEREVPENVIVATIIRVDCEDSGKWTAKGWECRPCVAPHPIAREFQYKFCRCEDAVWMEACGEQPIFSDSPPTP